MRFNSLLLVLVVMVGNLYALPGADNSGRYIYTVDLTKVDDDKIKVSLSTPGISQNEVTYYLPKIIPGTYMEADYGRFVTNFNAFDKKGRNLEVTRMGDNTWKILKAKKLRTITYEVNDTYDADMGDNHVYPMAGTNIEDKENFVLNTSGFFGYFQGMKNNEFEVNFIRPESFYGSTGLIPQSSGLKYNYSISKENVVDVSEEKLVDKFVTENYNLLIDSPIMYNKPDTTLIDVGGTEVLVSVYSPNGLVTSKFIADNIDEILTAQMKYLGNKLPVEKYAFIFFCQEPAKLAPIQGALEHSYSSFYYFPEIPQENLKQVVKDVAAHEFFHIVTPLNIHSNEIHNFDFNDPQMSKHLWMYEGVTEYSAHHVQVKYGLITPEQFLTTMQEKIQNASFNYNDTLSFTDLSKYTIEKYSDQYGNVYEKGALIGMLLDIQLRHYSDGAYGIQNLMKDLANKYGKNKAFNDDDLFEEIVQLTYPEIGVFFKNYLEKGAVLPYKTVFDMVGVHFEGESEVEEYSLGNVGFGYDPEMQKLMVSNTADMNEFGKKMGYQQGDRLVSINDQEIPLQGLQQFIEEVKSSIKEGDIFKVKVLRKNEQGAFDEKELSTEIFKMKKTLYNSISFDKRADQKQLKTRNAWLKP